jgi:hypothetical protein
MDTLPETLEVDHAAEPFQPSIIFPGAGPLEEYVHRLLQDRRVGEGIYRITHEELKDAVKQARVEYARDQYLKELRAQILSDKADE